jgi:hypothetical protein
MVTPAARREAVAHLQVAYEVSERRACTALGANLPRYGIEAIDRTMRQHAHGCASWRPFAGGSAIDGCTSCSGARVLS